MPTVVRHGAIIAGVDEAGRGPLAGPVAAGACILPVRQGYPSFITDSKLLTPDVRERAFKWIERYCAYGFGFVEAEEIDRIGILAATGEAMQVAIARLAVERVPTYLLVDGRDHFWFDYPHSSIVRGDETEKCIGAASIVAKVLRDHLMIERARAFPRYGFEQHKGYGTLRHIAAIRKYGPCPLHRRTFLKKLIASSCMHVQ